ncbi:Hypothetical_protein [Hexamita inflata]|uniref:Hypothetical_protein n=1 Tax=Hexamita inflata TaxID=28002 RepID=A0AA86U6Q9_9EUKA|nr:Hypothetical protein HINF_LOCUS29071 [Hexamita inflata]
MNLYQSLDEYVNQRYVMKKFADDYEELDRVEMIPKDVPNILDNLPNKYKQLQMYVNSNKDWIFKIKKTDAKILYSNEQIEVVYCLRTSKAASKQLEQDKQPTEEQSMRSVQQLDRKNTAVCKELSDRLDVVEILVKIIIQSQFEIVSMLQEISFNQQQVEQRQYAVEQRQQAAEAKNEKRILGIMLQLGIEDN